MEAFNLLRALSLDPNSVAVWVLVWFWLKALDASFALFLVRGWVLVPLAFAWVLGLAVACLRLGLCGTRMSDV